MINDIIQLLGVANSQVSIFWTNSGKTTPATMPNIAADGFTLSCAVSDEWMAPCTGILTEQQHQMLLVLPDGSIPGSNSIVVQLSPQTYLALCRLYATVVEGKTSNTQFPDRPVPKYFLYNNITKLNWTDNSGNAVTGPKPGLYHPGDELHIQGNLTLHDEEGIVIDPVAVAAVFNVLINTHSTLEYKELGTTSVTTAANRQINTIAQSGGNQKRVFCTDIYNKPFSVGSNFTNLTLAAGGSLFTLTNPSNPIGKGSGADALLQMGLSTNGLLSDTLNYPSSSVSLIRDFIRIKIANWTAHLLGEIPVAEPVRAQNVLPEVRDNETIGFCLTGNECLGEINRILSNAPNEQMLVSTILANDYEVPPIPDGTGNHLWPSFSQGIAGSTAPIAANLENTLIKTAHFITDATTHNTDVYFELNSPDLQNGWAIRVFTRVFHPDGRETRGNGAGGIVRNNLVAFKLRDPLRIDRPYAAVTLPPNALLMVDMVVVNSATPIQSRRFGNIVTNIAAAAALSSAEQANLLSGTNSSNGVANRAESPSGFLGVRTSPQPINAITNIGSYLLASGSDVQPRLAPTLPTQSRLEGLAAGVAGSAWSALCSGLRLNQESRENLITLGNPGSPGGNDTHTVGITSTGGRLAYDLARAALRRTQNFSVRMNRLINDTDYVLPSAPASSGRTFVAAVLQTIAKKTESPRLEEHQQTMTNLPSDAASLATQIQDLLNNDTQPAWLPTALKSQFKTALTGTLSTADTQLGLQELRREYAASLFGRRDTFYALKKAFENAQQFIYIETTLFGPTKYPNVSGGVPPVDDLIEVLKQQLLSKPGLKLILCLAQEITANRGYENIAQLHKSNRNAAVLRLLGSLNATTHRYERQNQVVAFHPLAFPGRPMRINSHCVLVDDVWGLCGSSGISQRSLYFDGSTDVVFCDKQLRNGKSLALANFRRNLMLQYIRSDNALPNLPDANVVFLQNGRSAFELLRTLVDNGGSGMIKPFALETAPTVSPSELAALENLADPNGDTFYQTQALLNTWLAALSTVPE